MTLALRLVLLLSVSASSFGWFSLPCCQMVARREVYTFPSADTTEQQRLADRLVLGEDERVFQPEQMHASVRNQYGQAVEGCKARIRPPSVVLATR